MQLFHWHKDLQTGMTEIDRQHQELIKRINAFLKSCLAEPRDYSQMIDTFNFLDSYVIEHFSLEEELMFEYEYPRIDYHLKDHRDFRHWVSDSKERISNQEFPKDLIMEANYRLVEWLKLHIRNRDKSMSEYLQEIAKERKIPSLIALIRGKH